MPRQVAVVLALEMQKDRLHGKSFTGKANGRLVIRMMKWWTIGRQSGCLPPGFCSVTTPRNEKDVRFRGDPVVALGLLF